MKPENTGGFIATKSSQMKDRPHDYKIVVHNKHKNKSMKGNLKTTPLNEEMSSVDMKKARFEVYKFSKSDLNFSNRQKSNVELAIQLGAKPKKNEAKNYKLLKAEKLQEKSLKKTAQFFKQISSNFDDKMSKKKRSPFPFKSKQLGILDVYGKVDSKSKKTFKNKR